MAGLELDEAGGTGERQDLSSMSLTAVLDQSRRKRASIRQLLQAAGYGDAGWLSTLSAQQNSLWNIFIDFFFFLQVMYLF